MHSANRAHETVDLRQEIPYFIPPDGTCGICCPRSEPSRLQDLGYQSCNIVSARQKSVAWMNGGWSTFAEALNSRLSTWLLTTSVQDFERAIRCIHSKGGQFKHNLWTHDINFISICHFQCNFCMTVTVLHLSFKKCAMQRRQLCLHECL